ncbi:MAG: LacI family transcriptional regulator [Chloroflexota bacterium]|nr:LacI family transcriptional regulator [Chloroflexota bacterium]
MKRPTIRDVAQRAGVSHQTVSRVLNGNDAVTGATRDRVMATIRDLDYVPSGVARSLSRQRTHTLGVVTTDFAEYAVGQMVAGVAAEAQRHDFLLLISIIDTATTDAGGSTHLRPLIERGVEGLLVLWSSFPPAGDSELAWAASRVPMVTATSRVDLPGIGTVSIDNRRGAFDATAHLIDRGHRAIATIVGPTHSRAARARLDGYLDALRAAGIGSDPALIQQVDEWSPGSGLAAARRLLDAGRPFTAIFAQNDFLASGAITELRRRGCQVPDDISIVGFDDVPVAGFFDPPLTSMRQPMGELGARAVSLVVDLIGRPRTDWPSEPVRHLLPASLVERASVRRA